MERQEISVCIVIIINPYLSFMINGDHKKYLKLKSYNKFYNKTTSICAAI